ncbi:hypothetical protein [Microlunatus parietis]|uniref:Uncharacterized protein n=1 Tax=Microlunatus parietis TaxID=682979 RepID=A0A7Y9I2N2_9ACTN|nr:hypothetical protein [Microlunatus parietis]NYE69012.1 hypothetical protein [Microlunatus parietis]
MIDLSTLSLIARGPAPHSEPDTREWVRGISGTPVLGPGRERQ